MFQISVGRMYVSASIRCVLAEPVRGSCSFALCTAALSGRCWVTVGQCLSVVTSSASVLRQWCWVTYCSVLLPLLKRSTAMQVRSSVRLMPQNQPSGRDLLQRSTAVQIRSSVRLTPQNQPSGRSLLPSPTACSPDQHHAAMLADVCRHILGRTEGRSVGFGQLVCSHK